jgi:hypothetical protein
VDPNAGITDSLIRTRWEYSGTFFSVFLQTISAFDRIKRGT